MSTRCYSRPPRPSSERRPIAAVPSRLHLSAIFCSCRLKCGLASGNSASWAPLQHPAWPCYKGSLWQLGGRQVAVSGRLQARQHVQTPDLTAPFDQQQLLQPTTLGDSSPSALFEAARTSVPLFQTLASPDDERHARATDSVLVEHIPGFASVGSSVYEVCWSTVSFVYHEMTALSYGSSFKLSHSDS